MTWLLTFWPSNRLSNISACIIYLDKVVDPFKVRQVVVGHVHANAEVQTSITSVDDLEVPELWN